MKSSGIGGQAVLEGVMMRHKEDIAVAVRKPDGSIEVGYQKSKSPTANHKVLGLPIIRGVVSFIYSLIIGFKTLSFSADFFEEEEEPPKQEKKSKKAKKAKADAAARETLQARSPAKDQASGEGLTGQKEVPKGDPAFAAPDLNEEASGVSEEGENKNAEAEKSEKEGSAAADEPDEGPKAASAQGALSQEALRPEQEKASVNSAAAKLFEKEENRAKNAGKIKASKIEEKETTGGEKALFGTAMVLGLAIAIVLFVFLPYWVGELIVRLTGLESPTLLAIIEGVIKLGIFIAYVWVISFMDDIKRTFMYHGAEHKCINCIESGKELTVENVMSSSKEHRRCGTSFVFFVLILSIIFFIFIRVDNTWLRMLIRLLLVPVIAGVSYEFIQWAGNSDSRAAAILSKPGLWVQALTTREPTPDMAEVGIASVEAVFDWRGYLREQGYEVSQPEPDAEDEAGA